MPGSGLNPAGSFSVVFRFKRISSLQCKHDFSTAPSLHEHYIHFNATMGRSDSHTDLISVIDSADKFILEEPPQAISNGSPRVLFQSFGMRSPQPLRMPLRVHRHIVILVANGLHHLWQVGRHQLSVTKPNRVHDFSLGLIPSLSEGLHPLFASIRPQCFAWFVTSPRQRAAKCRMCNLHF